VTFADERLLLFLPLSVVPAAVYFFLRFKKKRIVFPSLVIFRELKAAEIARTNRLKYAVLLLRCLFLFLIIFSFSGPYADWKLPGRFASGHLKENVDLVILSDESYSMSARVKEKTYFFRAHELAKKIIAELSETSGVAVISFSGKIKSAGEFMPPAEALEKFPSDPSFSYSGTDYSAALEKAKELLSGRSGRKKIIFLASDESANGLRAALKEPAPGRLFSADFGKKPLNFWFEEVKAAGKLSEKGSRLRISGKLKSSEPFSGRVRLRYCDTAACGNWRTAEFKKGTSVSFSLSLERGERCGYLETSGDALAADDRYYLCSAGNFRKAAFLYSGREAYIPGRPAYFAKEIFRLLKEENAFFDADFLDASTTGAEKLSEYSRIFAFSVSPPESLKPLFAAKIPFFMVPENPEKDFAFLGNSFPGLEGKVYSGDFRLSGAAGGTSLDPAKYELEKVYVKKFYALANSRTAATWLYLKAGNAVYPAFFRIPSAPGESYAFSFSAEIMNSNIALKPVFWDILKRTAESDFSEEGNSFFIGVFPFPEKNRPSAVFGLREGKFSRAYGPEFKCQIPGVYRGDFAEETLYFSCNTDPAVKESALEKAENPPWEKVPENNFMEEFKSRAYKIEVFHFLVLLAAASMALENLILWKYF